VNSIEYSAAVEWIEVPAWAVPVWVTLDGSAWQSDPLVEAVRALVEVGLQRDADIAAQLAMPRSLVQAAADHLVSLGALTRGDDGGLSVAPKNGAETEVDSLSTRPAWVVWDPLRSRPLFQLWLDDRPPGRDLLKGKGCRQRLAALCDDQRPSGSRTPR
jgi:hypothetical protein